MVHLTDMLCAYYGINAGVIWKGDKLIDGVPETLDLLRSKVVYQPKHKFAKFVCHTELLSHYNIFDYSFKFNCTFKVAYILFVDNQRTVYNLRDKNCRNKASIFAYFLLFSGQETSFCYQQLNKV